MIDNRKVIIVNVFSLFQGLVEEDLVVVLHLTVHQQMLLRLTGASSEQIKRKMKGGSGKVNLKEEKQSVYDKIHVEINIYHYQICCLFIYLFLFIILWKFRLQLKDIHFVGARVAQ